MKKKQIIYLLLVVCLGAFYGCSQEGFDTYQSENYIHFNKSENDSTTFSFAYDPSLTEGEVDIKLNIISRLEDRDRHFSVKFVPEESTAKEGVDFNVSPDELIVKANDSIGFLKVHVMKSASLSGKSVKAIFAVQESSDFKPGLINNRKAKLVITDKLTQPTWWDAWHISSGLGIYSDKKFRLFIQVTGKDDLTLVKDGGTMEYSDMRGYVTMFKYWLIEHPQTEDNGEQMTVPIVG